MTMRIDWLIDWDGEVDPAMLAEINFWTAWKGLNEMRQENYERKFGEYLWGQPRSDWRPWQHLAEAEDLIYPWSNWEARYPYSLCERAWYGDWLCWRNQHPANGEVWRGSVMAITRHDFYNIDTGLELMAAIQRAGADQRIDIHHTERLQSWLDREVRDGIAQSAGRRSLADRYRDLSQQIEAANTLSRRQLPTCEIDPPQLRESKSEQRFRLNYTYALRQKYGDLPAQYSPSVK
jgi:hypothetical protein